MNEFETEGDILQTVININEQKYQSFIFDFLGEMNIKKIREKKFLEIFFSKFDFFMPKEKQKYANYDKFPTKKQIYFLPLLVPIKKPEIIFEQISMKNEEKDSKNEMKIIYYFSSPPFSFWKSLFLRVRFSFIQNDYIIVYEIYWVK